VGTCAGSTGEKYNRCEKTISCGAKQGKKHGLRGSWHLSLAILLKGDLLASPELVTGHVNYEEVPVHYLEDENWCLRLEISAPLTEIEVSIVKMNNRSKALESGFLNATPMLMIVASHRASCLVTSPQLT